ncbi:MAG: MmcQ/YjbR family DNA-binding protein [Actinobacteria bacterium]|nr:MmcQ/YjbR family DNA-binding protein [Actinomycetota bacterium]
MRRSRRGSARAPEERSVRAVATMADLDELALAMPDVVKEPDDDGRPAYGVAGKTFCFHRRPRKDAFDAETGELLDDVLVFHVDGAEAKELLLADPRGVFFTTPHWNGYSAVLMRIRDLGGIDRDELRELVIDAWLARAPKRVARAWLAAEDTGGKGPKP